MSNHTHFRQFILVPIICLCLGTMVTTAQSALPTSGVPYAAEGTALQQLDVWLPAAAPPYPTIFLIHGGGFTFGDKAQMNLFAQEMVNRGYAVVNINYRLAPEFIYPAQAEDSYCALAWLYANAAAYGFDTTRIFGVGESAGGTLITLIAAADDRVPYLGTCPHSLPADARLRGVVAYYPLIVPDMNNYPTMTRLFLYPAFGLDAGQSDLLAQTWNAITPIQYLNGNEPPFLIFHGTGDEVVPAGDSGFLRDRLIAVGVRAELSLFPDADHGFIGWLDNPVGVQAASLAANWMSGL